MYEFAAYEHAGCTIRIVEDDTSANPWEEFDQATHVARDIWPSHYVDPTTVDLPPRWDDVTTEARERYFSLRGAVYHLAQLDTSRSDPYLSAFFFLDREDIIREYGDDSDESRARALELCKSEATMYRIWAGGEVHGYTVTDTETGELVGSCFGFYEDPYDENGYSRELAEEEAEHHAKDKEESHGRFLTALATRTR